MLSIKFPQDIELSKPQKLRELFIITLKPEVGKLRSGQSEELVTCPGSGRSRTKKAFCQAAQFTFLSTQPHVSYNSDLAPTWTRAGSYNWRRPSTHYIIEAGSQEGSRDYSSLPPTGNPIPGNQMNRERDPNLTQKNLPTTWAGTATRQWVHPYFTMLSTTDLCLFPPTDDWKVDVA